MSTQPPRNPISTPLSPLVALPEEIRAAIASHLNHADALSLRYTHSCFDKATELPLWRDLDLSITQRYGESPSICEHPGETPEHEEWLEGEMKQASAAYEARLRRKTTAILRKGNDRRFGMTRRAKFVNREGAVLGVLSVLECVSPDLQRLDVGGVSSHTSAEEFDYDYYRHIEYITLGASLSFPSLTHVYLGSGSVRYSGFILLLCQSAPNLTFLSAKTFFADAEDCMPSEIEYSFPDELSRDTRIRCLCTSYSAPIAVFAEVAAHSPQLARLSLVRNRIGDEIPEILVDNDLLQEFHCDCLISDFVQAIDCGRAKLPSLHTIVLRYRSWHDSWPEFPSLPGLRTLYLDRPQPEPTRGASTEEVSRSQLAQGMVPTFTRALCRTQLRTIRTIDLRKFTTEDDSTVFSVLDKPEYAAETIGVFRVIHNAGDYVPVRHARMLLDKWEIDDVPRDHCTALDMGQDSHFPYETREGVKRVKIFETLPQAISQDFTDYDGAVVPLEIISRMYEVEGGGVAESDEQTVEVGDAAWKVLMDWEEAQAAAKVD